VYCCILGPLPRLGAGEVELPDRDAAVANSPDSTNELSGDGYSPQSVDNSSGGWSRVQTGGPTEVENANTIDFGVLDSTTDKTVKGVVVYDGSDTSTANALVKADDLSVTVTAGNALSFDPGELSFTKD